MVNNYNAEKLELVNFLKKEKYTQFKDFQDNEYNNVYFYNKKPDKFHIVCISNAAVGKKEFVKDDNIKQIRENFPAESDPLILFVSLTDNVKNTEFMKDMTFLYLNQKNFEKDFKKQFSKFKSSIKKEEDEEQKTLDLASISNEELIEGLQDKDSDIFKSVKKTKNKIQASNLVLVWPYIIFLTVVPVIFYLIRPLIFGMGEDISNPLFFEWIFGGVNRDFLVGANQWWRLLVYPFIYTTSSIFAIFNLFIYGLMIYMCIRFLEVSISKWKILVGTFVGYIITGFVLGMTSPAEIFAGPQYVAYVLYGMLFFTIFRKQNVTSVLAKNYTFWIPITFLLWPLFDGNLFEFLYIFLGVSVGGILISLLNYNWKEIEWFIGIPILCLIALIIIPIILMSVEQYVPPVNYYVYHSYLAYDQAGLMSEDHISSIFNNYYFKSPAWVNDHFGF
ncbi:rhomboid family intramembrane serine protease [Spiroplasma endosymbiont of Amphibalanus improvisus]|uniref:rhomboid family intramembrane serine protease n=1 Tax=Spiroplasma endosymbiont of Amphibalanus improvisus TaxID=3066327 RepID=UPI00313D0432